jgi:hypothetical protein
MKEGRAMVGESSLSRRTRKKPATQTTPKASNMRKTTKKPVGRHVVDSGCW